MIGGFPKIDWSFPEVQRSKISIPLCLICSENKKHFLERKHQKMVVESPFCWIINDKCGKCLSFIACLFFCFVQIFGWTIATYNFCSCIRMIKLNCGENRGKSGERRTSFFEIILKSKKSEAATTHAENKFISSGKLHHVTFTQAGKQAK